MDLCKPCFCSLQRPISLTNISSIYHSRKQFFEEMWAEYIPCGLLPVVICDAATVQFKNSSSIIVTNKIATSLSSATGRPIVPRLMK